MPQLVKLPLLLAIVALAAPVVLAGDKCPKASQDATLTADTAAPGCGGCQKATPVSSEKPKCEGCADGKQCPGCAKATTAADDDQLLAGPKVDKEKVQPKARGQRMMYDDQGAFSGRGRGRRGGQNQSNAPGAYLFRVLQQLDLTETQKDQLKELRDAHQAATDKWRKGHADELQAARTAMQKARESEDRQAMQAARAKAGELYKSAPRLDVRGKVMAILTDEQKAKVGQIMKKMRDQRAAPEGQRPRRPRDGEKPPNRLRKPRDGKDPAPKDRIDA